MKTIFIKDDRLRKIEADLNEKIVEMSLNGKLKGSYTIEQSTKEFKTKTYPFYEILFGWEIIDYEDGWKIKERPKKKHIKEKAERIITELKNAELQKDGTIKVNMEWAGSEGTINYQDFKCFCGELIKKILRCVEL